jgi:ribulose-phosphate 3-epimerase
MVHDPLSLVESFAFAGANAITFQCESVSNIGATLQKIRSTGCKAGVAIGPISLVSDIADYLDLPDLILIMSVRPGKCRQEFLPIAANKLNELRNLRKRWGLNYKISIDGGINCTTVHTAAEAGADIVVAGSAFFDDPPKFLTEMRTIARQS